MACPKPFLALVHEASAAAIKRLIRLSRDRHRYEKWQVASGKWQVASGKEEHREFNNTVKRP